eukprot:4176509-Pleurochrysis_carterae.AAC.1
MHQVRGGSCCATCFDGLRRFKTGKGHSRCWPAPCARGPWYLEDISSDESEIAVRVRPWKEPHAARIT